MLNCSTDAQEKNKNEENDRRKETEWTDFVNKMAIIHTKSNVHES